MTQCERREVSKGEWTCDRCKSLWYGELAKTDWRPSECPEYSGFREKAKERVA